MKDACGTYSAIQRISIELLAKVISRPKWEKERRDRREGHLAKWHAHVADDDHESDVSITQFVTGSLAPRLQVTL